MIDVNDEKYSNKLPHPQLRKQKYPEPKRKDFDSYAEHGIAMDEWDRNVCHYDAVRPKLIKEFNKESSRLSDLFMYDLLDEMGWLGLSDRKQLAISAHLWENGDGNRRNVQEVAYDIAEMVDTLIIED